MGNQPTLADEPERRVVLQLIRLPTNLNQLTKLAHTLREADPTGRLGPLLDRVSRMLDELL